MKHADSSWLVYICTKSGKLYVGITTDLKHRMKQHVGAELLYREGPFTEAEAANRERQLKGWSRVKKLRLLQNKPGISM
ncbi:MAG TPA: GIY-YIG nuclease family protein [Candidatus Ozemobacteraceae bacterium]